VLAGHGDQSALVKLGEVVYPIAELNRELLLKVAVKAL
jgi:hypothetical protein